MRVLKLFINLGYLTLKSDKQFASCLVCGIMQYACLIRLCFDFDCHSLITQNCAVLHFVADKAVQWHAGSRQSLYCCKQVCFAVST